MARSLQTSDQDLAIKLAKGDMTALSKLIDRYQAPLTRYASYLGSPEPEDIAQLTFIKLYQNIKSYDPSRKFSSWLYRIAHNLSVSSLRSTRFTVPFAEYLDGFVKVEDQSELELTRSQIESCLSRLPAHYRAPLVLYYLEDKTYGEIMDILRLPGGTVSARLNRAKKLMRSLCQK